MYGLLRYVPKNYLSYAFGILAGIPLPRPLAKRVNTSFARLYRIDLSECELAPECYPSLNKFFTRNLRAGTRPIGEGVVSPVDGTISCCGAIEQGTLFQAKGKNYSLDRLVADAALSSIFQAGYYFTIYLAPKDYHHIHAPVDGRISACYYVPGALWPVNSWSVANIDELFCVNERIITLIDSDFGKVAVVKIGATNVGAISVSYDDVRANSLRRLFGAVSPCERNEYSPPIPVKRGDRIGTFNLGSTVILLFEKIFFRPEARAGEGPIRLGTRLDEAEGR